MATVAEWISWFWAFFVANRESIVSLATILAGLIGIPLLYIRTRASERSARAALKQAKVAAERHEEQTKADLERRITESFAKAVEQLGSEKLATRLGGIYTLERLSYESKREYGPIMETLTAFVRERAPWPPHQDEESPRTDGPTDQEKKPKSLDKRTLPATDVQAVLTVLGRREEEMRNQQGEGQRLDLSAADLRGANLIAAHLEGANFMEAHLERALLSMAHLKGAYLIEAHLEGAHLRGAHLEGAHLRGAHLEGAHLIETHLERALLSMAHLEGADLIEAHLEGAYLEGAKTLTQEQIGSAFGDEFTTLPEGLKRPSHWTKR